MIPKPDDWADGDSPFRKLETPGHNHPKPRDDWKVLQPNCPRCAEVLAERRRFGRDITVEELKKQ